MVKIKFGTAGWRGIISDDFTFENVKIAAQAIADYINNKYKDTDKGLVIGYDPRFLGDEFAKTCAEVLSGNSIKTYFSKKDVPTPAISLYVRKKGLQGAINITASHNPPEYSGIKFSPESGGPALPETTDWLEKRCEKIQEKNETIKTLNYESGLEQSIIEEVDLSDVYIQHLTTLIDMKLISKSLKIAFDPMYGSARDYIPRLLGDNSLKAIHDYRDVLFGGHRPEPAKEYLDELESIVLNEQLDFGIATDGDADRFGIIDSDGTFITPNILIGLMLYHLHVNKGYKGVCVRSVMTSSFIDAIADKYSIETIETPVGFKYIGDVFVSREMIVGGEESGGLTIGGHIPEKDGILACLLAAELRAKEGRPLMEIAESLQEDVGRFITKRINYRISDEAMNDLRAKMSDCCPDEIGGLKVKELNKLDGYKFILEEKNSWVGMRFSGTEPVVRIYAESHDDKIIEKVISSTEELFGLTGQREKH